MAFLTKQEKYVVAFLIIGAICGLSYSYYKRYHPPINLRFTSPLQNDNIPTEELDNLLKEAKSVNINTASLEELMKLKGIGPVLAGRIIEYREKNDFFKSKEEIKKVPGIGEEKYEAIRDYIILQ